MNQKYLIILFLLISSCSQLKKLKIEADGVNKRPVEVAWIKNNDPVYNSGNLPIALNSPLVHRGIVYAGDNNGFMVAYDVKNGRELWRKKERGTYHSAPVFYKNYIFYGTTEGRVYARHAVSGKLRYSVDLDAPIESAGTIFRGRILFHLRNHKLFSLDIKTGKILWSYKRSISYTTTLQRVSRPLIWKNKVFAGFADGFVVAFSFEDGLPLWEKRISLRSKFVDVDLSPIIFADGVLVSPAGGPLTLLDPETGNTLKRSSKIGPSRTPVFDKDGNIVLGTLDGEIIVIDDSFRIKKRSRLTKESISSVSIWKNNIVASTVDGQIYFLSEKDLTPFYHFPLGHISSTVFGDMSEDEGHLAVISSRNRLYLFR